MDVENFDLTKTNITLVYDELNSKNISLDAINDKFGDEVTLHKLNPNIYLLAFNNNIQFQLGQRRVVASYNSENQKTINSENIEKVVNKLFEVLDTLKNTDLNAFGFNYDGIGYLGEENGEKVDSGKYFLNNFHINQDLIENNINGKLKNFNPNLAIEKNNLVYNIKLNSIKNTNKFNFHFNVHYDQNDFLNKSKITEKYNNQYEEALQIIKLI